MTEVIKNAIIESVILNDGDRDLLTAWLSLDYGASGQGFGGYCLYLPKSYNHHDLMSVAGHFIYRCMQVAGASSWDGIKGKTIRVKVTDDTLGGKVIGIGHIVKDDWFYPEEDFNHAKNSITIKDGDNSVTMTSEEWLAMYDSIDIPAFLRRLSVPKEWQIVPKTLTPAMQVAFDRSHGLTFTQCWEAVLKAAPMIKGDA